MRNSSLPGSSRELGRCNRNRAQARVIALLQRDTGATLGELVAATGWLAHTTRAALTGLRHKGFVLDKRKREDGTTGYRISSAPTSQAGEAG
jgi:DNA-binding IclR family transcriptional regulator